VATLIAEVPFKQFLICTLQHNESSIAGNEASSFQTINTSLPSAVKDLTSTVLVKLRATSRKNLEADAR